MLALLALPLAACGGDDDGRGVAAPSEEGPCESPEDGTLLAEVCDSGTLTVSTDPEYPPQSSLNKETGEYEGFDIDVATEIAEPARRRGRLGGAVVGRRSPRAAGTAAGT